MQTIIIKGLKRIYTIIALANCKAFTAIEFIVKKEI